jgi:hypothetical protein
MTTTVADALVGDAAGLGRGGVRRDEIRIVQVRNEESAG